MKGIYKITNVITNECYIGSSNNIERRFAEHKSPNRWKRFPNVSLYININKYGINSFKFEVIEEIDNIAQLKVREQYYINEYKPVYNKMSAYGRNAYKQKEIWKRYRQSEKGKEYHKKYEQSDAFKERRKKYYHTDEYKEYAKKYRNQLCEYNGEIISLEALRSRFRRTGITSPTAEAKKYLIKGGNE